ncbi:concanavalin A-like lectin/glucanase domain-containing protein [Dactylonectria estremocensis]|uniref:Concanavalin A-like lectin/glucanase domain-containing protein n=1 Tax=Dactylonectria estremocensis TaxID=1079267 RepID=A0A9P9DMC3_9HYPO|nr:concanavalin A-like lectin/glucanase domain-containing protein [Dactylonectria estremocensis]
MRFSTSLYGSLPALVAAIQAPNIDGLKIAWQEDFTGCQGCSVNLDTWNVALDISVNNELQEYSKSNSNIQLSGGESLQLVPWKSDDGQWTSGRIESKTSWMADPGCIMRVEAQLRSGESMNKQGMWPAFWMLGDAIRHGTEWPTCGELDIFERVNGDLTGYGTVHCGQLDGGACNEPSGLGQDVAIPDGNFHNWAIVIDRTSGNWQTETITWLLDGTPFHSLVGSDLGDEGTWGTLAHSPMYILLNVAVGGNWPGYPDDATESGYGNMMEVMYVAVYESA